MPERSTPFRLQGPLRHWPAIGPAVLGLAERALAFERLANIYRQISAEPADPAWFAARALELLQVRFDADDSDWSSVPETGPAIVVANHPYGGLEGLFLIAALLSRRPDARLLANQMLQRLPEVRDAIIPVDAFGGRRAAERNRVGLRKALRHVRDGGLLAIFPAGTVSHLHLTAGRVCDPPWSATAARLIRLTGAPVTPIHFGGGNSVVFQSLGLLHPRMRTVLLSHELLNKRHRTITVSIGRPVPAERIADHADDESLSSFLRLSTYALEARRMRHDRRSRRDDPLAAAISASLIEAEMSCLPQAQVLTSNADIVVFHATAEQIPWVLREIGRQREIAFRQVGEGTGRSSDLDHYDQHYVHLVAWHRKDRELAGAYRIGHVDEIAKRLGPQGLYTHSLFAFGDGFLDALGPALELGRSFVSVRYQKQFGVLLLLWRAIADYVFRHPRYHVLFGPVSVSSDYLPHSHALIIEFLQRHCFDARLARRLRPRRPFRRTHSLAALNSDLARLRDPEGLSSVLEAMEPDHKGIPILLKQYLKLGGKLVGFNVDAGFGNVVDGMIVVDLLRTEKRTLQKYMGRENAQTFLETRRAACAVQP